MRTSKRERKKKHEKGLRDVCVQRRLLANEQTRREEDSLKLLSGNADFEFAFDGVMVRCFPKRLRGGMYTRYLVSPRGVSPVTPRFSLLFYFFLFFFSTYNLCVLFSCSVAAEHGLFLPHHPWISAAPPSFGYRGCLELLKISMIVSLDYLWTTLSNVLVRLFLSQDNLQKYLLEYFFH